LVVQKKVTGKVCFQRNSVFYNIVLLHHIQCYFIKVVKHPVTISLKNMRFLKNNSLIFFSIPQSCPKLFRFCPKLFRFCPNLSQSVQICPVIVQICPNLSKTVPMIILQCMLLSKTVPLIILQCKNLI
jgi:hypothetical protein